MDRNFFQKPKAEGVGRRLEDSGFNLSVSSMRVARTPEQAVRSSGMAYIVGQSCRQVLLACSAPLVPAYKILQLAKDIFNFDFKTPGADAYGSPCSLQPLVSQ